MLDEFGNYFSTSDVVASINNKLAQDVFWYVVKEVGSSVIFGVFSEPVEASESVTAYKVFDRQSEPVLEIAYEIIINKGTPLGMSAI